MSATRRSPTVLDLIVIDCPDPLELARFYAAVLGWDVPADAAEDSDFVTIEHPEGGVSTDRPDGRVAVAFQRIADWVTPTWPGGAHPQQMHLDITAVDIEASEADVLGLGARKHEHQPSEKDTFRVYLDPAGHPFCLLRGS